MYTSYLRNLLKNKEENICKEYIHRQTKAKNKKISEEKY